MDETSSNGWLDTILNTGKTLYTTYSEATRKPQTQPPPVQPPASSSNSRWYIFGGIGLAVVAVLVLLFRRR